MLSGHSERKAMKPPILSVTQCFVQPNERPPRTAEVKERFWMPASAFLKNNATVLQHLP